jgi:hypothetical protein
MVVMLSHPITFVKWFLSSRDGVLLSNWRRGERRCVNSRFEIVLNGGLVVIEFGPIEV